MLRENQLESVIKAKNQIVQGAVEIWNVRLELLRNTGTYRDLLEHLVSSAEISEDNSGCNTHNCDCISTPGQARSTLSQGDVTGRSR